MHHANSSPSDMYSDNTVSSYKKLTPCQRKRNYARTKSWRESKIKDSGYKRVEKKNTDNQKQTLAGSGSSLLHETPKFITKDLDCILKDCPLCDHSQHDQPSVALQHGSSSMSSDLTQDTEPQQVSCVATEQVVEEVNAETVSVTPQIDYCTAIEVNTLSQPMLQFTIPECPVALQDTSNVHLNLEALKCDPKFDMDALFLCMNCKLDLSDAQNTQIIECPKCDYFVLCAECCQLFHNYCALCLEETMQPDSNDT